MKLLLLLVVLLMAISTISAKIEVTEVMFNPENTGEWVEFFNLGEEMNLSGMKISDNYQTDMVVCCTPGCALFVPNGSFFIISDKAYSSNITDYIAFCVDDNLIGNGLGNLGDTIILIKNNETEAFFEYNATVAKGFSLALFNDTWQQAIPSPGYRNDFQNATSQENEAEDEHAPDIELLFSEKELYAFAMYDSLIQAHNKDYPGFSSEINATAYYNISHLSESNTSDLLSEGNISISFKHTKKIDINFQLNISGEYLLCAKIALDSTQNLTDKNISNNNKCQKYIVLDPRQSPCNISLKIITEKQIYAKNESIGFENILSDETFPFEIEYWAEDLFGNKEKDMTKTRNTNKKHFSFDIEEDDKAFLLKSNLTELSCNNTSQDIFSEKLIIIKGEMDIAKTNSSINVPENLTIATFGDIFYLDIMAYRGDTRKTLIEAYIKGDEKISYVTSAKINKRFEEISMTLPIQIKDNCEKRYKEGNYNLVVEGIDSYVEKMIYVKKNPGCPKDNEVKPTSASSVSGHVTTPSITEQKDKAYELVNALQDTFSSEVISTVKIYNKEDVQHSYDVWSYLYKGAISYSGERESNKIKLYIGPFSNETITLRSKIMKDHPRDIMLKIKILREDRKTPYEITRNLTIDDRTFSSANASNVSKEKDEKAKEKDFSLPEPSFYSGHENEEDELSSLSEGIGQETGSESQRMTGSVIYESKGEKIKLYSVLFVLLAFILGIVAFMKLKPKKENIY